MSELYSSIEDSVRPISTNYSPSTATIPTYTNPKAQETPNSHIITNIVTVITNILNSIDNHNYTDDDELNLEKCLFNIQYKLKSPTVPTNIKDSLNKVKNMLNKLTDTNNLLEDLYIFNNCLIVFNDKLNQPLDYKLLDNKLTHNVDIPKKSKKSLFNKVFMYLSVIGILYLCYSYESR
jgi:hypothetical protein